MSITITPSTPKLPAGKRLRDYPLKAGQTYISTDRSLLVLIAEEINGRRVVIISTNNASAVHICNAAVCNLDYIPCDLSIHYKERP